MLNDGIFFIDEALLSLADIRKIECEKADPAIWNVSRCHEAACAC